MKPCSESRIQRKVKVKRCTYVQAQESFLKDSSLHVSCFSCLLLNMYIRQFVLHTVHPLDAHPTYPTLKKIYSPSRIRQECFKDNWWFKDTSSITDASRILQGTWKLNYKLNYKKTSSKLKAHYIHTMSKLYRNYEQTTSKLWKNYIQIRSKLHPKHEQTTSKLWAYYIKNTS